MKRSTERILTTHTGSLPRPGDLLQLILDKDGARPVDEVAFERRVGTAVAEAVKKQVEAGLDIVNDGEMGKIGYSTYVKDRLTGFDGEGGRLRLAEADRYPEYFQRISDRPSMHLKLPSCNGPITLRDRDAVHKDIKRLQAAVGGAGTEDTFMTAASPGVISQFLGNTYYPSREAYLYAIADAMKYEYTAIADAGFVLQLDCPDLAMSHHIGFAGLSLAEFRKMVRLHVEVLNYAVAEIPPEQLRVHLCWGNYPGPHDMDVPLKDIIDVVLSARASAISFEGANPRHAHEWKIFRDVKLPEGKAIIPGVIDSTTNYVEHPELVAERLSRYARLVGRENVIAGSDCGFGTFAGTPTVDPRIVWAKFRAMAEGAKLASQELW